MLRNLYDRTMGLAAHRHAAIWLFVIGFVESSIFPVPPDVLLIPMVLAARDRWWRIALNCTVASVLGGIAGYALGFFLYEQVAGPILAFYRYETEFAAFRDRYDIWGPWAVFVAGITPFPYKVITLLSGSLQLDLAAFTLSSLLARGMRFFLVAALFWHFGPPIRTFVERRLGLVFTVFVALLAGGFVAVTLLH